MNTAKDLFIALCFVLFGFVQSPAAFPDASGNDSGQIFNTGYDATNQTIVIYDRSQETTIAHGEATIRDAVGVEKAMLGQGSQFANFTKSLAAEVLPDEALVVRGGLNTPESVANGVGTHPSGITGVSVESSPGLTVEQLASGRPIPNSRVGVTTVGDVRAAGGDVIPTSGQSPYHATLTGLTPEQISELLNPHIPNPVYKKP